MKRINKNDDRKSRKNDPATKKSNSQSPGHKEDFNTGIHSPSALLNVGPGYDDTGMGNDPESSGHDDNNAGSRQNKRKSSSGKN
jgi:hypothetical protein